MTGRIDWSTVLAAAVDIVDSYDTSVTLRQLHYRLVSRPELGYPNNVNAYKQLSSRTAEMRRFGTFPSLIDRTRSITQAASWTSPKAALRALARQFRLDRTEGQDYSVWLGVEKDGLVTQLESWFGEYGVPIIALRGYSSQSFADEVVSEVDADGRDAVLLYAGDHDPSGEDIDRDFAERTDCWHKVVRVALTADQVAAYGLPLAMGKTEDSRAAGFVARHGQLVQVELDALDPNDLHSLYSAAFGAWWDVDAHDERLAEEETGRVRLQALADELDAGAS